MSPRPSAVELLETLAEALRPLVVDLVESVVAEQVAELAGPTWLTLEQAAEHVRSTPGALRKRAQRGRLPGAVKDEVGNWLVHRPTLDAALVAATVAPDNRNGRAPR